MTEKFFNQIENKEKPAFRPEFLSFDELLVLAKRLQERLEIYRDEEALNEDGKVNRDTLLLTVQKVETILDKVTRKIDILKALKVFYGLYESWAFLVENKKLVSYEEYLEDDYNDYLKRGNSSVEIEAPLSAMAEMIESQGLPKNKIEEIKSEAEERPLPASIEVMAENPEAKLIEAENSVTEEQEEKGEEVTFADIYQVPVRNDEEFLFQEKRLADSIERVESELAKAEGAWGKSELRARLERKYLKLNNNLELLRKENLENKLDDFFASRLEQLEKYLLHEAEGRNHKALFHLYNLAEKFFHQKVLSEKLQNKLKKQGFWGKALSSSSPEEVIEFSLLGGALALGSRSILSGTDWSPEVALDFLSNGAKTYPLLKVASQEWAEAHAWENPLPTDELDSLSLKDFLQYFTHYEAKVLLAGANVEQDTYYQEMQRILKRKYEIKQEKQLKKLDSVMKYFSEENKNLSQEMEEFLPKEERENSTLFGLYIANGDLRAVLDKLFFSEKENETGTISEQFSKDGVELASDDMAMFPDEDILVKNSSEDIMSQAAAAKLEQAAANHQEDDFAEQHPLLLSHQALMDVEDKKLKLRFSIDKLESAHFKTLRGALRICALDAFPTEKLLDKDGFSAIDAARLEKTVTILAVLLSGNDYENWPSKSIEKIAEYKNGIFLVKDYRAFTDLIYELFDFDKKLTKAEKDIYVKVAQYLGEEFWTENLARKLAI